MTEIQPTPQAVTPGDYTNVQVNACDTERHEKWKVMPVVVVVITAVIMLRIRVK